MSAQSSCLDGPDLEELEILCVYEDQVDLNGELLALDYPLAGTWSVLPEGGGVFVYLGWLFYENASPGNYVLTLEVDNPSLNCPATYTYNMEVIDYGWSYPIPELVCIGEPYFVGDTPLYEEGFHEVYLPREPCDSLVQVLLFYDEAKCEDPALSPEETEAEQENPSIDSGVGVELERIEEIAGFLEDEIPEDNVEVDTPSESVFPNNQLIFPTAFSPDNNGINDSFGIVNRSIQLDAYRLHIMDRWGRVVFKSTDATERWEGRCLGKDVLNGVYTFSAYALTVEGKEIRSSGPLTLLR